MNHEAPLSIRTLLVSDVHLGCKHARTDEFLRFIQQYRPDRLYLVGDFFDAWKINSGWHWSDPCDRIVDYLVGLVEQGTEVYYTPGNHDAFLRQASFQSVMPAGFPAVKIADEFIFETLHGWRFLVTHGDLFDFFETRAQWISRASSLFYDACLSFNRWIQRRFLAADRNPYGACAVVKGRVKRGVKFISRYERKIMRHAAVQRCDGVICGHIHTPAIKHCDRVLYCNTGDWVENCTGLVEHHDGRLQLVSRYERSQTLQLTERSAAEPIERDPQPAEFPAALSNSFTGACSGDATEMPLGHALGMPPNRVPAAALELEAEPVSAATATCPAESPRQCPEPPQSECVA